MDLHDELERHSREAASGAGSRLQGADVRTRLDARVARARRIGAAKTGAGALAAVGVLAVGASLAAPLWESPSPASDGPSATPWTTTVIDDSTPVADASFAFPAGLEKAPLTCGSEYAVAEGATRQSNDAAILPLTVTAASAVGGSDASALEPGAALVTWTAAVESDASLEGFAFNAYGVTVADGVVVASSFLGGQTPAGGGLLDALDAPMPGVCGGLESSLNPDDGDYTFHLWVQVVDGTGTPVATVVDPVAPETLDVEGLGDYRSRTSSYDGLPNLAIDPIQCGDASSVEGRLWQATDYSESLPEGVRMPGFSTSLQTTAGVSVRVSLSGPLVPDTVAAAQAFGVVDGVVVGVSPVALGADALNFSGSVSLIEQCGQGDPAQMDVYVIQMALDESGEGAEPRGAVVFRFGTVDTAVVVDAEGFPTLGTTSYLADAVTVWAIDGPLTCQALADSVALDGEALNVQGQRAPIPAWLETGRLYGWGDDVLVGGTPAPLGAVGQANYEDVRALASDISSGPGELVLTGADGSVWGFAVTWEERDDLPHDAPGVFAVLTPNYDCHDGVVPEGVYEARLAYASVDGSTSVAQLERIVVVSGVPSLPEVDAAGR